MSIESDLSPLRSEVSLLETHDSQFAIAETSREKSLWLAPVLMLGGVLTLFGATVLCVGAFRALSSLINVL
jgi:hypothetical protein